MGFGKAVYFYVVPLFFFLTYVPISLPPCVSLPPTLPIPPLHVVTKHRADLPALRGCFPPAIYLTLGSAYMSMPPSHHVTSHPSPSPYPQVHSLVGLCLYSRPATRFFMTSPFLFFSQDSIYMCQHTVSVFLLLIHFTLYDRLQLHPPHYK